MIFQHKKTKVTLEISKRAKIQQSVLKVLIKDNEMSTKTIEEQTGHKNCYSACRALEDKKLLKSKIQKGGKIFWDTYTELIMTRDTYDTIMSARNAAKLRGEDIGPIIPIDYWIRYWWFNKNWEMI